MITVIVTFKISDELDADILKEKFIETSTLYQDVTGLRRKNYIGDIENNTAGGVYTFDSMQDAKNWFDEDRIYWITERYSKPEIKLSMVDLPQPLGPKRQKILPSVIVMSIFFMTQGSLSLKRLLTEVSFNITSF